jgi:hypothetical protein
LKIQWIIAGLKQIVTDISRIQNYWVSELYPSYGILAFLVFRILQDGFIELYPGYQLCRLRLVAVSQHL